MSDEESYAKYLVKGSAVAFGAMIATALLGLGIRIFMARALSVAAYGTFFAVLALLGFLTNFRRLGMGAALGKYLPEFKVKEKFGDIKSSILNALLIRAGAAFSIAAVLWIFSEEIALGYVGTQTAIPIIRVLSVWFVVQGFLGIGKATFQGFKDIVGNRSVDLFRLIATLSAVSAFSYFKDLDAEMAAISYLFGALLTIVWTLVRLGKHRKILQKAGSAISKSMSKKLLAFGLPLLFSGIAGSVIARVDTMLVAVFRTPEEVGLYEVAYPISRYLAKASSLIAIPLLPMVSELLAKKDERTLRSTLSFLTKFLFILIIPPLLAFLAFPDVVIRVLFRQEYVGAALALQILAVGMAVRSLGGLFQVPLIGAGETGLVAKITGAGAGFNLAGNLLLIPIWGIEGAAVATLLTFGIFLALRFYFAHRIIRFPVSPPALLKTIAGGILTLLLIFALKIAIVLPMWPELFAIFLLSGLFYFGWIFGTGAIRKDDLKKLRKVIPVPGWLERVLRKFVGE